MITTDNVDVSARAMLRMAEIGAHIEDIGQHYGTDSVAYRDTAASWLRASHQTFNLLSEGGSLASDGDRGLYIVTPYGMHVGVVFFRDRAYDTAMTDQTSARVCIAHHAPWSDPDSALCPAYVEGNDRGFCMVRTMFVPGTWSLHS